MQFSVSWESISIRGNQNSSVFSPPHPPVNVPPPISQRCVPAQQQNDCSSWPLTCSVRFRGLYLRAWRRGQTYRRCSVNITSGPAGLHVWWSGHVSLSVGVNSQRGPSQRGKQMPKSQQWRFKTSRLLLSVFLVGEIQAGRRWAALRVCFALLVFCR